MAQTAKMLDVTRSYIPMNPNAYVPNLMLNAYQDAPEKAPSVVAYDGRNFLPTSYGYRSYFGISRSIQTDSLPSRADHIICFQNKAYQNVLVALCEDGIYIKHGASYGSWVKKASVEVLPDTYREWSYCTVGDSIYCYRTNDFVYYCIPSALYTEHAALTFWKPFLTMATQTGSSPYGVPAGTYRFAAAARYSTGWISGATEWSSSLTIAATYILTPYVAYQSNEQLISVRFYIDNGTEIRYKDVVPSPTQHDIALCSVSAADWAAMQVVTSVPDEDWYSIPFTTDQPVLPVTPAFINMAGQLGIFSAGTRLGFWDSEDSVSWSSIDDYTDFTPSLTTLAGSSIFSDVQGRIVTIRKLGDGFVIYATKSIVYVKKAVSALLLWEPVVLLHAGISYSKQVTSSTDKKEHWAWTSSGLAHIEEDSVELVVPEIYDLYKRHNAPVYLDMLDNRYLAIQIMDEGFELRNVLSTSVVVPGQQYVFETPVMPAMLQDMGAANLTPSGYKTLISSLEEAHTNAAAAAGVTVNFGQYAAIYNWTLSKGYRTKAAPVPSMSHFIPCGTEAGAQTAYFSFSLGTLKGLPLDMYGANVINSTKSLEIASSLNKVGYPWAPLNNVAKFIVAQVKLWELADAKRMEMLNKLVRQSVSSSSSFTWLIGSAESHVLDPAFHINEAAGIFSAYKNASTVQRSRNALVERRLLGYVPVRFGAPEIDVGDCSFTLQRTCIAMGEVWVTHTVEIQSSLRRGGIGEGEEPGWDAFRIPMSLGQELVIPAEPSPIQAVAVGLTTDFQTVYVQRFAGSSAEACPASDVTVVGHLGPDVTNTHYRDSISATFTVAGHTFTKLFDTPLYRKAIKATATVSLENITTGSYGTDKAYMKVTGFYHRSTGNVVDGINGCQVPVRGPYNAGTHSFNPPVDPSDGTLFGSSQLAAGDVYYEDTWLLWDTERIVIDLPATKFMLQEGSPAPAYPTFYGALVYDTALKKWGRLDQEYKLLLNYTPINGQNGQAVAFSSFQMQSGLLDQYGSIRLFDDAPTESYIRYGKLGYSRKSFTNLEEVHVQFATPSTCSVIAEPSLDGDAKEANYKASTTCTDSYAATLLANLSARWYNVVVSGKYDISHIELHAHTSGRR